MGKMHIHMRDAKILFVPTLSKPTGANIIDESWGRKTQTPVVWLLYFTERNKLNPAMFPSGGQVGC